MKYFKKIYIKKKIKNNNNNNKIKDFLLLI